MQIIAVKSHEFDSIDKELIADNAEKCRLTSTQVFDSVYYCLNVNGKRLGGISGKIELQYALHIKTLWIDKKVKGKNAGKKLLNYIDNKAALKGATFSYLETFDFQAKDFYVKNGYEVFSELAYVSGNIIYF